MLDLLSCTTKLDEATCFICVLCLITGIARVDGVIYSTDPIFSSGCSRVLYVCFPYEVIWRMTCSIQDEHVMGCDVTTFFIRVHSACRICEARIHFIQMEGVRGWTLSMQRLDAWIPFLYWTVMYLDASMMCWHGRFVSAGTLTTFRKSISVNWVAPTSYYKESRL
jgi:hypothetical protein